MLSPYTVLDLTDERGELAGMLLGDMGADVIKVEPPNGSSSRRMPPFLDDAPEPERSLQFFAFNRNKRSITLDLPSQAGRSALLGLVAKADFLIESANPGEMSGMGLGFDDLRKANPLLIHVAITAFGQDGPYAQMAASDLTLAAMGGPMSLQGSPDRPPVRLSVPQVWLHASAEAAVGALTAHALMVRTGEAQFVDVSAQTAMVWTMLHGMAAHAIQGYDFNRGGSDIQLGTMTLPLVYQCADGHVVLITSGATMSKMVYWLVEDGIVPAEWIEGEDWPTYERRFLQGEPVTYAVDQVIDALRRYVLPYTKNQLLERGLRESVTVAPVSTVEDLARFRQLEERGYWLQAPLPNGREIPAPGVVAKLTATPMEVRRWAPTLGQHNDEVLGGMLGLSAQEISAAIGAVQRPSRRRRVAPSPSKGEGWDRVEIANHLPFEGVKIADFSWVAVGPIT
ncbi:MAG: CoA transferase, partial [Chloroflexi bacterium]|nr:CoA transferase [Chloroflexota bacterium]